MMSLLEKLVNKQFLENICLHAFVYVNVCGFDHVKISWDLMTMF